MKRTHLRGRPPFQDQLTPSEWKVVEAVRHGLSNPQIASRQGVGIDAVKYHVGNALHKLGLKSRMELRQWTGVARASALGPVKESIEMDLKLGAIGQIARTVKDAAAARRWYGDVLGLPHLFSFGKLAFFDCNGVRLFLSEGDGGEAHSILYFAVPDIHSAHRVLQSRGVEFASAPHMIHKHADGIEEWMAFFKDLDGHPLALMSRAAPRSDGPG